MEKLEVLKMCISTTHMRITELECYLKKLEEMYDKEIREQFNRGEQNETRN